MRFTRFYHGRLRGSFLVNWKLCGRVSLRIYYPRRACGFRGKQFENIWRRDAALSGAIHRNVANGPFPLRRYKNIFLSRASPRTRKRGQQATVAIIIVLPVSRRYFLQKKKKKEKKIS